jgi:hypothetical protein
LGVSVDLPVIRRIPRKEDTFNLLHRKPGNPGDELWMGIALSNIRKSTMLILTTLWSIRYFTLR